jgi:hypothetical protein
MQEDKRFKNLPLILITFSSSGFHLPVSSRRKGKGERGKRENIEKVLSMMKRTPQLGQKSGCTLLLNNILPHAF